MSEYLGKDIFKLGFGLMRLPKLAEDVIDVEQTKVMADMFIEAGGKYFDTAYVYDDGRSEEAFAKAVAERYPRDKYFVCTKLNARVAKNEEDAKQQFWTSLERCKCEYFDFYLLHALGDSNYQLYEDYHLWDYVKKLKEDGLIRHYGFSFHGSTGLLEQLLNEHPEVDFVQLQVNYADWNDANVASGECVRIVRAHNKPFTIMEPIKGGKLADPIAEVKAVFDEANSDASYASWAVRYAAGLDGVIVALSGMSNIEQMKDNLSYMRDFKPLNEDEQKVIAKVQQIMADDKQIKCTACHYCTEGCPMSIPIPEIFALRNRQIVDESLDLKAEYQQAADGKGKASDCIECGQCESACPQSLKIIDLLKQCRVME